MKRIERRSPFWSRLLGLLITFVIIAVLVFGGVKNLTSELSCRPGRPWPPANMNLARHAECARQHARRS